jgi:cardiolipin synthase
MVTRIADVPPLPGNSVKIFTDAHEATESMLAAIDKAERTVHLEVYQFKPDESGRRYLEALTAAAGRGVEVCVLYDDVGSLFTRRSFFAPLDKAKGRVAKFLPVNPFRGLYHANLRNHRKILVVDGAVGFTGGLNIGTEYGGWRKRRFGPWRDTHVELRGPAVVPLQEVFVEDWLFATRQEINTAVFPDIPAAGEEWVHALPSGPDSDWEVIHHAIFTQVTQAREHVYLTTSYFVPDRSLLVALQTAALRGVDVRILLPARSDDRLSQAVARYHYRELLRAGIRIFEYEKQMLHAKTVEIDGRWSTIGSANLDLRSFRLNFELNLVVYGESVAKELQRIFVKDLTAATEVKLNAVEAWPLTWRLTHGSARLLEPIL